MSGKLPYIQQIGRSRRAQNFKEYMSSMDRLGFYAFSFTQSQLKRLYPDDHKEWSIKMNERKLTKLKIKNIIDSENSKEKKQDLLIDLLFNCFWDSLKELEEEKAFQQEVF